MTLKQPGPDRFKTSYRSNKIYIQAYLICYVSLKSYYRPDPILKYNIMVELSKRKCLNVRQKLGTRTLSQSHAFTLLFTHSRHAEQLLFSCLCSKVTLSLSHSLTLTLSHSHTHSHTLSFSHSLSLDMLNNFCFHVYARGGSDRIHLYRRMGFYSIQEKCSIFYDNIGYFSSSKQDFLQILQQNIGFPIQILRANTVV